MLCYVRLTDVTVAPCIQEPTRVGTEIAKVAVCSHSVIGTVRLGLFLRDRGYPIEECFGHVVMSQSKGQVVCTISATAAVGTNINSGSFTSVGRFVAVAMQGLEDGDGATKQAIHDISKVRL